MSENRVKLFNKLNGLRGEIIELDWSPDKSYILQGKAIKYISVEKVKRQVSPVFKKVGVEFLPTFREPTLLPSTGSSHHWMIAVDVTLVDCDSAESYTSCAWGESVDSGDKGITKAQSVALKNWFFSTYNMADGIESSDMGDTVSARTYNSKTPMEVEIVKAKIAEAAKDSLEPAVSKEEPESKPKPVPETKEEPVPEVKEVSSDDVDIDSISSDYKLNINQAKSISTLYGNVLKAIEGGVLPEKIKGEFITDRRNISSAPEVLQFLKKYKSMLM